jgi:hypothetical protein
MMKMMILIMKIDWSEDRRRDEGISTEAPCIAVMLF